MMRCLLLLAALAAPAAGADAPAPAAPTPGQAPARPADPIPAPGGGQVPALDPATSHRAEQAADAYLQAQAERDGHPDPAAEHALADAEVELLEAQAFLDQHQPLKAGERYLEATKLITGIAAESRAALGARLRKASAALTALSRRLLDERAFDLGSPDPAVAPAAPPPGRPAAAP